MLAEIKKLKDKKLKSRKPFSSYTIPDSKEFREFLKEKYTSSSYDKDIYEKITGGIKGERGCLDGREMFALNERIHQKKFREIANSLAVSISRGRGIYEKAIRKINRINAHHNFNQRIAESSRSKKCN